MIFSFKTLGIDPKHYNGMSYSQAHGLIVNTTCNYIMRQYFYRMDESVCIPNPRDAFVNFVLQTVDIQTVD